MKLARELRELSADIVPALEQLPVCAFIVDSEGRIRWANEHFIAVFGDLRGRPAESIVAPEDQALTRSERAKKLLGVKGTSDYEIHLMLPSGERRRVELSSVALKDGSSVVGVFGILRPIETTKASSPEAADKLTPRQHEVLRLLARGSSTRQIAADLHLSVDTVRNHVRGILKGLGVHSRIQAIAVARRNHLL